MPGPCDSMLRHESRFPLPVSPSAQNFVAPKVNSVLSKRVHKTSLMQTTRLVIFVFFGLVFLSTTPPCRSQTPPPGFTALFNGKDLTGWRGGETFDHRKWLALPETERAATNAEWTADMRKHWRVENRELVNDGHG